MVSGAECNEPAADGKEWTTANNDRGAYRDCSSGTDRHGGGPSGAWGLGLGGLAWAGAAAERRGWFATIAKRSDNKTTIA